MRVRVKICGINSPGAYAAAASAGADWVGFVFFAASPRHVTLAEAAMLAEPHLSGPLRVGLFVDPDDAAIAAARAAVPLDAVQIYAPAARIGELASRLDIPVWHAIGVGDAASLPISTAAAALVVEAKPPPGATRPGGNAVALDWAMLRGWKPGVPWLLAGGLTPENLAAALAASHADAVDVSSGVERAPGVKDAERIAAFVAAARATSGRGEAARPKPRFDCLTKP